MTTRASESSSSTEQVFRIEVRMSVDYELHIKAKNAEQAEEYAADKFRGACPDEDFFVDATLDDVYSDEDKYCQLGDEDLDATEEPPKTKKKGKMKGKGKRRSS